MEARSVSGMKFLFVNNVASVVGGTMACTLSMIKSLPDCQHKVFAFSGRFGDDDREIFGSNVELQIGLNLNDLRGEEFDVVVYQNTHVNRIPNKHMGFPVYYHHSNFGGALEAARLCDLSFCVSRYLADLLGIGYEAVLHQPVPCPPKSEEKTQQFTVGRICNPAPRKWRIKDVLPPLMRIHEQEPRAIDFHFVGCPDAVKNSIMQKIDNARLKFFPAHYTARKYLSNWECVLYLSDLEETFGRIVREAQRAGCVPIVSDKGGFSEQIIDGSGFLVGNDREAADAVLSLAKGDVSWIAISDVSKSHGDQEGSLRVWRSRFLKRLEVVV